MAVQLLINRVQYPESGLVRAVLPPRLLGRDDENKALATLAQRSPLACWEEILCTQCQYKLLDKPYYGCIL